MHWISFQKRDGRRFFSIYELRVLDASNWTVFKTPDSTEGKQQVIHLPREDLHMMVIEHRRDMQRTLKLENNRLEEVPEISPKRSRKTDTIPGIHLWNAFGQQQATPAKRGQKRDRRKSDTTSTRIRTSGLEGADLNSEATSLGPAEQRCLPSSSDGSSDPDAAVGAPVQVHIESALESSDLMPVNINTTADILTLGTHPDSQLLDPNSLAAVHEHGTYEAQSGAYGGIGAESAQMIYSRMSGDGQIYSIEQHSRIPALQHFQSSYGEPITPSETSASSQLPTPISAQPCDHQARSILVYKGACGHLLYMDTHSGIIQHADFLTPGIPRISADTFSNTFLFADNFNSDHINVNQSASLGSQSGPIYDQPLEQGFSPTGDYGQTMHTDWTGAQRSHGSQLHLNISVPTNPGPTSAYLQTSPEYLNFDDGYLT